MEAAEGRANYTSSELSMSEEKLHSAGIVSELPTTRP